MRDIKIIIEAVLAEIPEGEYQQLRTELSGIQRRANYTAPEMLGKRWQELKNCLASGLGDPTGTPWKETINDIMAGKINIPGQDLDLEI